MKHHDSLYQFNKFISVQFSVHRSGWLIRGLFWGTLLLFLAGCPTPGTDTLKKAPKTKPAGTSTTKPENTPVNTPAGTLKTEPAGVTYPYTTTVRGKITDDAPVPAVLANVSLSAEGSGSSAVDPDGTNTAKTSATLESGRNYTLTIRHQGDFIINFTREYHEIAPVTISPPKDGKTQTLTQDITAERLLVLKGTIKDRKGNPVGGIKVKSGMVEDTTDDGGNYELPVKYPVLSASIPDEYIIPVEFGTKELFGEMFDIFPDFYPGVYGLTQKGVRLDPDALPPAGVYNPPPAAAPGVTPEGGIMDVKIAYQFRTQVRGTALAGSGAGAEGGVKVELLPGAGAGSLTHQLITADDILSAASDNIGLSVTKGDYLIQINHQGNFSLRYSKDGFTSKTVEFTPADISGGFKPVLTINAAVTSKVNVNLD